VAVIPAPATFVAGTAPTDANLNSLRDGINFLLNPPRVLLTNSALQSVPSGVSTVLTFDTETYDTDAMHSTVTNPDRITTVTAGLYTVSLSAPTQFSSAGPARQMRVHQNGAIFAYAGPTSTLTLDVPCVAGDYLQFVVYQNSGVALSYGGGGVDSAHFCARRVSA